MSEYGSAGPQGSYGPPGTSGPATARPAGDPAQLVMITNYAAAGLGVLGFIWGFLDWFSQDGTSQGLPGYAGFGDAAVGLTLAAGLIAGAAALEKRDTTLVPAAVAAAALLVAVGQLIKHTEGLGVGIGLILTLVTTILQTGALVYGWMLASGRMSAPSSSPKPAQNQWGGGGPQGGYGYQQPSGSYPAAGQYQPPSYPSQGPSGAPQQSQYGPSAGQPSSAPPAPPQGGQPSNPYGPPQGGQSGQGGGYGPPQPGPSQSGPSQSGTTSSMPAQGNPYGPPSSPAPGGSEQPGQSGQDAGGYGEATRHIPRYTGPGASNPDEPSGS